MMNRGVFMLAVISRYKLLFVILLILLTAALVWVYIAIQDGDRDFSKGVFVMDQYGYSAVRSDWNYFSSGRGCPV